jgi:ketosteroid isomerase-like protein
MTGTPVDIARRVLSDPTNPALVKDLVAEDSVYVSLNQDEDLKKIMPWAGTGDGRDALRKTFSDVARYWQIEEFDLGDAFGDDSGKVAVFGRMKYSSTVLAKTVISPFAVYAKVADGKIVYAQFMEDSFATARSFRSGGTWTISSDPDGHAIEV